MHLEMGYIFSYFYYPSPQSSSQCQKTMSSLPITSGRSNISQQLVLQRRTFAFSLWIHWAQKYVIFHQAQEHWLLIHSEICMLYQAKSLVVLTNDKSNDPIYKYGTNVSQITYDCIIAHSSSIINLFLNNFLKR